MRSESSNFMQLLLFCKSIHCRLTSEESFEIGHFLSEQYENIQLLMGHPVVMSIRKPRPILFQWFWENTFDLYFQLHWWTKMNSQQHLQNSSTLFMNIVVFKSSQTKWVPTYTKSQLFKWLKWKSFPFYYDVDIYKNSSWMNNNGKDRLTFPLKWGSKEGLLGLW